MMNRIGSVSIVVSIPACHVGDLGSIPRRSGESPFKILKDKMPSPSFWTTFLYPIFFLLVHLRSDKYAFEFIFEEFL